MVRDPLWWFAITAVGWALAIASCWSARTLVPFVVLAGMAIGQGLLLGKQVKPWVWATLSFVANSVALGLFLLGFAQLYRGNSIRTYALMFALPLGAGLISVLPPIWALYRARKPLRRCIAAYALPWPAAILFGVILVFSIGPMPGAAPAVFGVFVGIVHGAASARALSFPEVNDGPPVTA